MAIINRISRLFRADLHAVIDQLEEPQMLLKQSVREMEEALCADRQQLTVLQQQQRQLQERLSELDGSITKAGEELDLCFESNNETLARTLIRRKLESQQFYNLLNSKQKSQRQHIEALQTRIDEAAPQLQAMQQKLELLADEASQQSDEVAWPPTLSVTDADVEVALLRARQQRMRSGS